MQEPLRLLEFSEIRSRFVLVSEQMLLSKFHVKFRFKFYVKSRFKFHVKFQFKFHVKCANIYIQSIGFEVPNSIFDRNLNTVSCNALTYIECVEKSNFAMQVNFCQLEYKEIGHWRNICCKTIII